ncbi:MAG TPA: hypothetical protein DEO88_13175 [Syntrophobacteraceae bacterium]|nr:hypothetical protein [Syntrophobacteraceae bacterium]
MRSEMPYANISGTAVAIPVTGGSLAALVRLPTQLPAPTVICCHGLLSSKDSSKFAAIVEDLCQAGFATVRFDFSGCGESRSASEASLLGTRLRDLLRVMAFVQEQDWNNGQLGLMGCSLGGYLALLGAADSSSVGVKALVCWATPFDLAGIRTALESGNLPHAMATASRQLGEPQDLAGLPPLSRVLVVHGQQDATVGWRAAIEIYRRMADPKELLLFEEADHRFVDPACRNMAIQASTDWFRKHLAGSP